MFGRPVGSGRPIATIVVRTRNTLVLVVSLLYRPRRRIWDLDAPSIDFLTEEAEGCRHCQGWLAAFQLLLIGRSERHVPVNGFVAVDRFRYPLQRSPIDPGTGDSWLRIQIGPLDHEHKR